MRRTPLATEQINTEDTSIGKGEDNDIIGNLGRDEISSHRKLKLNALYSEDGLFEISRSAIGGDEAVLEVQGHGVAVSQAHIRYSGNTRRTLASCANPDTVAVLENRAVVMAKAGSRSLELVDGIGIESVGVGDESRWLDGPCMVVLLSGDKAAT
ncbi:hypothetical protein HG530_014062 [Fusarium avenaceum]|nr:hypothetical protein HG530_014062 [Fusarium avenaceum]